MALVDFNITIETHNPDLNTGIESSADAASVIDGWSPRWTQYIRLAYLPTKGVSNDSNLFMKLFGNSLSFMSWSAFNQWYPGTAVVSDPVSFATVDFGGDALTKTGLSQYTLQFGYGFHDQNITWNGNFIDAVVARSYAGDIAFTPYYINGNSSQIYAKAQPGPTGTFPGTAPSAGTGTGAFSQTDLVPRHAFAYYNANISAALINNDPITVRNPSTTFSSYMGRAYSILGNDYLSRQRSCMWRIVPRFGSHFGTTLSFNAGQVYKNNSFTLEVQFDKPILHISTPFADRNFRVQPIGGGATVKPYKYLTVNGQAMLRYSDKTQSTVPAAASIGVGGGGGTSG